MAAPRSPDQPTSNQSFEEQLVEAERKRDMILLLENLSKSEEATIKLILDCIYDVGSVRFINHKFRSRSLRGLMKWIACLSKPAFRVFAFRWFRRNCPELIVNWLYRKISFERQTLPPPPPRPAPTVELARLEPAIARPELDMAAQEIRRLRSQLRLLRGISVGAIATLGVTVIWLSHNFRLEPLQMSDQAPSRVVDIERRFK